MQSGATGDITRQRRTSLKHGGEEGGEEGGEDEDAGEDEEVKIVSSPKQNKESNNKNKMDLLLLIDCTASMGSYIAKAKSCIADIATRFQQQYPGAGVLRIGVIAYRDHPPQDLSYVTRVFDFSDDAAAARAFVDALSASGGGDGPEAVGEALSEAVRCDWRPGATKVAVLIADAPPHGIGESGDGFPQGVPGSADPFVSINSLSATGVRLYPVGCLPALANYRFAIPFFIEAARKTGGKSVALEGAHHLGDVIFGASLVEMGLAELKLDAQRRCAAAAATNPTLSTAQLQVLVASDMCEAGVVYRSLGGATDLSEKTKNAALFSGQRDLAGARNRTGCAVDEAPPDGGTCNAYRSLGSDGWVESAEKRVRCTEKPVVPVVPVPDVALVTETTVTADFLEALFQRTV